MQTPLPASKEAERLAAVRYLNILDSEREESFDRVTRLVCYVLGVPMAAVSIVDETRQWFKSSQGLKVRETPRSVSFCDYTIRQQAIMEVADARLDKRFSENPLVLNDPNIVFYAGYPLYGPDGLSIGALCAIDIRERHLDRAQRQALEDLGAIVQDQFALAELANRDVLTGLTNRRYFDDRLEQEWRRQRRHSQPLSLLFFDVDHFKAYNDNFGHERGDEVLRQLAEVSQAQIARAGDIVSRYGGEEFVALLPGTDAAGAREKAEQLRAAVENLGISRKRDSTGAALTISVGVATVVPDESLAPKTLLERADQAMYRAKDAGRNQVCSDQASLS